MGNKNRQGAAAKPIKPKATTTKSGTKSRAGGLPKTQTKTHRHVTPANPPAREPVANRSVRTVRVIGPTGKARMVTEFTGR